PRSLLSLFYNILITCFFFLLNDTATNEIYTLSLHDALPILNGKIETNSEILAKRAEQYLNLFIFSYYTINDSTYMTSDENIYIQDRKSTRLNSSHVSISYAVFCLKKKNNRNSVT